MTNPAQAHCGNLTGQIEAPACVNTRVPAGERPDVGLSLGPRVGSEVQAVTGSIHTHPDNRGVFVERWVLDLLAGDLPTAFLFSQLLWWHQPGKDGRPKVRYERNGFHWLLRSDDEWEAECALTVKQVRRSRGVLVKLGLIEHKRFKRDGAPTSAWRPLFDAIQAVQNPIRPDPELPSEGQFHGSDPQGAVGSDPGGAVPKEKTSERDTSKTTESGRERPSRATRVPDDFALTDDMRRWAFNKYPTLEPEQETEHFLDYHRGKGSLQRDWPATWRTWMHNAARFRDKDRQNGSRRPMSNVERSWQNIKATEHLS